MTARILCMLHSWLMITAVQAGIPMWTFVPLTPTTLSVPANGSALVQYRVTNQSSRPHILTMKPIQGVTQITTGLGVCGNPFILQGKSSCTLSLQVNGSQLTGPVTDGPVVCQQGSLNQCYRPSAANILRITQTSPITDAVIAVQGSPLLLTQNGPTGQLTINNTSTQVTATNIISNFTGTALEGNVAETGNTCASVAPGGSCTLTYTPGNTVVPQTNFTIQGSNTNALTAAIAIQEESILSAINPNSGTAAGGTGVTLTGSGLTGATAVTFGGVPATSVNVVNSTTVTAVTPAHAAGVVDVVIDTPAGGATLANGYTYVVTAVGQPSGGGIIACLNGGLDNLIAATADNSASIEWGGLGIITNAQSSNDGAANTTTIVNVLGANGGVPYAAQLCEDYQIDSQGNTPCEAGNTCYNDWFLPAAQQLGCLNTNNAAIGGFTSFAGYWSSTEDIGGGFSSSNNAFVVLMDSIVVAFDPKSTLYSVRCTRTLTP